MADLPVVTSESSDVKLIPRAHLFANPVRSAMTISPDGQWLAWLASVNGVKNVWAAPRRSPEEARQLTFDTHRGIPGFSWSYLPGVMLFSQDSDGDENWKLFALDVSTATSRALTSSKPGVRASIHSLSRSRRDEILVTVNERDPRYPDLCVLNLRSGEMLVLEENTGYAGFLADQHFNVRLASRSLSDGGREWLRRASGNDWEPWIKLSAADAFNSTPSHFSADGLTLYFYDSRGRDTAALVALGMETDTREVLAEDPRADIGGALNDMGSYRPLAYGVSYERYSFHVLDECIRPDIDYLDKHVHGEWHVSGRTEDDRFWLISASSDVQPSTVYMYDRASSNLEKLFDLRPELDGAPLARMQSVTLESRDGLKLVSYVTIPVSADVGSLSAKEPVPMVVLVHGGPWARDVYGYNAMHQWLANRGYAVLSVNFRSSIGFGKSFIRAGDGEWGRKMDDDIEDAVQWAVSRGIADPTRLAILGGSYGGFAVLSAMTRFPERYACGIDVVGPSNLETLLASVPAYWESARAMQERAIGNPNTAEGLALLRERSPLHRAGRIRAPLLVAQGKNDPRVKQAESEQMVAAMQANGVAVTYALYPDEGHGFVREPNRMSFNALCETFLARVLGGRQESWSLADFPGNSLVLTDELGLGVA